MREALQRLVDAAQQVREGHRAWQRTGDMGSMSYELVGLDVAITEAEGALKARACSPCAGYDLCDVDEWKSRAEKAEEELQDRCAGDWVQSKRIFDAESEAQRVPLLESELKAEKDIASQCLDRAERAEARWEKLAQERKAIPIGLDGPIYNWVSEKMKAIEQADTAAGKVPPHEHFGPNTMIGPGSNEKMMKRYSRPNREQADTAGKAKE